MRASVALFWSSPRPSTTTSHEGLVEAARNATTREIYKTMPLRRPSTPADTAKLAAAKAKKKMVLQRSLARPWGIMALLTLLRCELLTPAEFRSKQTDVHIRLLA